MLFLRYLSFFLCLFSDSFGEHESAWKWNDETHSYRSMRRVGATVDDIYVNSLTCHRVETSNIPLQNIDLEQIKTPAILLIPRHKIFQKVNK